jgi:glycosyltransferase involved in cell wall biosynthesis
MPELKPRVVVVAPFSISQARTYLGASAKIELIIAILASLGYEVHLVDSSHSASKQATFWSSNILGRPAIVAGIDIYYWRPFTLLPRKLGKLLNVAILSPFALRLTALNPSLIWIYNSYAFEARLALKLADTCRVPIVLELEDLPLARSRGLNPKPYLDEHFLKKILRKASLITYVNASLIRDYGPPTASKVLLPSILGEDLVGIEVRRRFGIAPFKLGYFGGLETDKGAHILLEVLSVLPPQWQLVITGAGQLRASFEDAAKRFPNKIVFLGLVVRERLIYEMQGCDAIVNPHQSIADMANGVFPFKVCEAIASGALLISTPLPDVGVDMQLGVRWFDGSADSLLRALETAKEFYFERHFNVQRTRELICDKYGVTTVARNLAEEISHLMRVPNAPRTNGEAFSA